jgi:O-antigen ligase
LQLSFLLITLAAVPLAMLPKALALDQNTRLPFSFRERIVIWDDLARLTLQQPILGIGVNSIKFHRSVRTPRSLQTEAAEPRKAVRAETRRTYWHPHNGYLQIWLELGAIGAILFAIAGTLLLGRIAILPSSIQPFAAGLAATTLAIIGPGWGLWQPWLIASIGFGWVALLTMRRMFEDRDDAVVTSRRAPPA